MSKFLREKISIILVFRSRARCHYWLAAGVLKQAYAHTKMMKELSSCSILRRRRHCRAAPLSTGSNLLPPSKVQCAVSMHGGGCSGGGGCSRVPAKSDTIHWSIPIYHVCWNLIIILHYRDFPRSSFTITTSPAHTLFVSLTQIRVACCPAHGRSSYTRKLVSGR